jgi:hypothetical protein
MLALKWKKRHGDRILLEDGPPIPGHRGLLTAGGSGSDGPRTHRPSPLADPAVLASMSTFKVQRQHNPTQARSEERGFNRVSGRKLPSVLQYGGDGYTDPRQSVISGTSSHYRESPTPEMTQEGTPRLALGSPMRPISGIPIVRSGPARTPVTEHNPFFDPPSPASNWHPDPIGRSLTSQDGSRASRFAEEI